MGESWKVMESEMDRFEAEISSLGTKPTAGSAPIAVTPSFIPASVRKVPVPLAALPRPKIAPVVISGGPQLYARSPQPSPTTTALMRPTQISQRLIRPGLLPGSPPITPATGHCVVRSPIPGFLNGIPPPPQLLESSPTSSNSTFLDIEKPSTSGFEPVVLSTSHHQHQQPVKKKKKKKQDESEKKPKKHLRAAGGTIWEDPTLLDWDPKDFRLFCGDLGNDVTDEVLTRVFGRYPSFVKARVIRDKRSNKTKGYGFVSFKDPNDFVRAIRELDGRYVGSRPIKLRKSTWENRGLGQVRKRDKLQKQLLGIGGSGGPKGAK